MPHDTRYHLCHVLASGVFPTLAVTDARGHGSAIAISKKQLWNLFSLDKYVLLNSMKCKIDTCISKNIRAIQTVLNTLLHIHTSSWSQICDYDEIKFN